MPTPRPTLTVEDATAYVADHAFDGAHERRVGIELEWIPVSLADPTRPPDRARLRELAQAAGPFPHRSRLSFEPGAQLELSTPPEASIGAACTAIATDARSLIGDLADSDLGLVGIGLDPRPLPERVVDEPRYVAMQTHFDSLGSAGRTMMCGTAAIQVNLDPGDADAVEDRWRLAHAIGPTLTAAFANSPLRDGVPTGWRSTRMAVWSAIDGRRTGPVPTNGDCRTAWATYAMAAPVMLVRETDEHYVGQTRAFTFADWVRDGHELGYPDEDDLEYHLTTLFPPVRPRGWLELRMCDAVPDPWWRVAVATTAALLDHPDAARTAMDATADTADLWEAAARRGLHDSRLARSARACFAAARSALEDLDVDATTLAAFDAFLNRYVLRGRCPADDLLVAWTETGTLLPDADTFDEVARR